MHLADLIQNDLLVLLNDLFRLYISLSYVNKKIK